MFQYIANRTMCDPTATRACASLVTWRIAAAPNASRAHNPRRHLASRQNHDDMRISVSESTHVYRVMPQVQRNRARGGDFQRYSTRPGQSLFRSTHLRLFTLLLVSGNWTYDRI